jgi:predicted ArsR family transcriptional regulator/anti-sigma regulatory factor (Ser/Thr protein kinase)
MDWYVDRSIPAALSELRREIRAYLYRHSDAPSGAVDDAELIAGELLANAYDHSTGPIWVELEWAQPQPVLSVRDLGSTFTLPNRPPAPTQARGRGLWLVSQLAPELTVAARGAGKIVEAVLPVTRPVETSVAPPRRMVNPLPHLDEARDGQGFGRDSFLRALAVQLATAIEQQEGPDAAQRAVAQVAVDVGGQMELEYRRAKGTPDRPLTVDEIAECLVRLKSAIGGTFRVVEVTPEKIVLVNGRCPFGPDVRQSPSLCRMTSAVFGGIAAHNTGAAAVSLEERIAVGDDGCRVVVRLGPEARKAQRAHLYIRPAPQPQGRQETAPRPPTGPQTNRWGADHALGS